MVVDELRQAFAAKQMAVTDGTQYVRLGGKGPAVLLLHGFGDTGDMWVPLADALVKDHAVIVPDLRGMGLSSHPEAFNYPQFRVRLRGTSGDENLNRKNPL